MDGRGGFVDAGSPASSRFLSASSQFFGEVGVEQDMGLKIETCLPCKPIGKNGKGSP